MILHLFLYREAINLFESLDDRNGCTKCNLGISDAFYTMGLYDSSFVYLNIAKSEVSNRNITDSSLIGSVYYTQGNLLTRMNEIDSAEHYLNKSLVYCQNGLNDSLYSLVNKAIGNINFSYQKFQEALRFYRKSLQSELTRVNPSDALIASLYQNMGIIMDAIGYVG